MLLIKAAVLLIVVSAVHGACKANPTAIELIVLNAHNKYRKLHEVRYWQFWYSAFFQTIPGPMFLLTFWSFLASLLPVHILSLRTRLCCVTVHRTRQSHTQLRIGLRNRSGRDRWSTQVPLPFQQVPCSCQLSTSHSPSDHMSPWIPLFVKYPCFLCLTEWLIQNNVTMNAHCSIF